MLYIINDLAQDFEQTFPCDARAAAHVASSLCNQALANLSAWGISAEVIDQKTYHNLEVSCRGAFCVALGGKGLFPNANSYLNITRAVTRVSAASDGPFHLIARPGH